MLVSSMLQQREGWPVVDRVIDAPVNQDTLTWKRQTGRARLKYFFVFPLLVLSRAPFMVLAMFERCGLIADS